MAARQRRSFLLAKPVEGRAQALTLIIERDRTNIDMPRLIVDRRVAQLRTAVEAHAKTTLFTETSTDIEMATGLSIHGVTGGETGQVFIEGAFRHHVDHAAHRVVGDMP